MAEDKITQEEKLKLADLILNSDELTEKEMREVVGGINFDKKRLLSGLVKTGATVAGLGVGLGMIYYSEKNIQKEIAELRKRDKELAIERQLWENPETAKIMTQILRERIGRQLNMDLSNNEQTNNN